MTSIDLFPPTPYKPFVPDEWGTGQSRDSLQDNKFTPKPPTWHCSGEPIEQKYQLTPLQLSNLRLNDQMIPDAKHVDMGKMMIDLPFPAEHPYSSHIQRTALFPSFDSPNNRNNGQEVSKLDPKNSTIPANAYDITVIKKTKGAGYRHELQALPSESRKKPLHWLDHDFDQKLKYPESEKQDYYPIPARLLNPNATSRDDGNCFRGNMVISPRTADTLKNVERDQWTTTYDRNYTGSGPVTPYNLDNYHDKMNVDGAANNLSAATNPTFDPPRPVEGRIARTLVPPPSDQTQGFPAYTKDQTYTRKLTASEREEYRLLYGQDYVNSPDGWKPDAQILPPVIQTQVVPPLNIQGMDTDQDGMAEDPNEKLGREQHDRHQQIEAANKWHLLESQKPHHNTLARQHKMELVSSKEQPGVFYQHENKFQGERAGMYKTSYDPYALQHTMNKDDKTGARLMDISECHKNSLDLNTVLNTEMSEIIRYNRCHGNPGSVPQFHDQPSQYEAIGPFDRTKSIQKSMLQPNAHTAGMRIQEGQLIQKESTYGDDYNTKKFLQENKLPLHARNEPLELMSKENQNLQTVRFSATPMSARDNWLSRSFDSSYLRPKLTTEAGVPLSERYSYSAGNLTSREVSNPLGGEVSLPKSCIQSRYLSRPVVSQSTNFLPSQLNNSWMNTICEPKSSGKLANLSLKDDSRFQWDVNSGTPRPQTRLLDIQNSFRKSEVREKFHQQFPENGVDLRDNITLGKKHNFNGMNAQFLRGTPIVD